MKPAPGTRKAEQPAKLDGDGQSFARGSTRVVHEPEPVERLLYVQRKGEPVKLIYVPMKPPVGFRP